MERSNLPPKGDIQMASAMFTGDYRDRHCPRCGERFRQYQLSPRFDQWLDAFGEKKAELFRSYASEQALPLLCIPCERKDLGSETFVPVKPTPIGGALR